MSGHTGAVYRTTNARPRSSEPSSGAGVAPQLPEPGFIALSANWHWRSYLELGAFPTAVPCARLHARALLGEWGLADQGDLAGVTELVVSELVTNAYQTTVRHHLDTPIRFRLAASRERVLIEIWDGDATALRARTSPLPPKDATSGRGLFLVDTLSARWSWYALQRWSGKVVWAEVTA